MSASGGPLCRAQRLPASPGLALIRDKVFSGKPDDRAHAMARYEANVNAVRATVPKERLLVHELGDG